MKRLLLSAVATLGLTTATMAQTVPNYVPTNGLVGWWPFNGNANDESGNGNNGTVNGATLSADRFGNLNKAYFFNGSNNYISVLNLCSQFISKSITVSIWANTNQVKIQSVFQDFIGSNSNRIVGHLNFQTNGNTFWDYGNINNGGRLNCNIPSILGNWEHYVFIADSASTSLKIYKDGNLVCSSSNSNPNFIASQISFSFGGSPNFQYYFSGILDDIGIWDRALTQQEIISLYNGNICYQYISVTDTLFINTTITSFNPLTYQNTIKVFPNPANTHITIDYGNFTSMNGYQLKITNSLSQQVFLTNINQQSNYIDLSTWSGNGIYFVHLIDPQGNIVDIRKIVLQ